MRESTQILSNALVRGENDKIPGIMDRKFVPPIKSLKINEGVICISLSRAKSLCKSLDAERLVCFPFERAGKTRCNRSFRQLTNVIEEKFEQQGSVLNRCRVNRSRKLSGHLAALSGWITEAAKPERLSGISVLSLEPTRAYSIREYAGIAPTRPRPLSIFLGLISDVFWKRF